MAGFALPDLAHTCRGGFETRPYLVSVPVWSLVYDRLLRRDDIHQQIWVGITDTDRVIRYYDMLSDKLRLKHQVISALLAAIACGAAVPLLTRLPDYLAAVMFFIVAVATIWLLIADYSSKATAARLFCDQYRYLAAEWRQLWYGKPTQAQIDALWEKYNRITGGYDIPVDNKLNRRAMEEADAILPSEFANRDNPERLAAATPAST